MRGRNQRSRNDVSTHVFLAHRAEANRTDNRSLQRAKKVGM
jgi:hypothetical protein